MFFIFISAVLLKRRKRRKRMRKRDADENKKTKAKREDPCLRCVKESRSAQCRSNSEICSELFSKKRIVAGNAMLATHEHQRCPAVLVHRCPGRSDGHGNQRDLNSNAQTHSSTCWT